MRKSRKKYLRNRLRPSLRRRKFFDREGDESFFSNVDSTPVLSKADRTERLATSNLQLKLDHEASDGRGLPSSTREDLETRLGADFSGVRIHTDNEAVAMNRQIDAEAFAYGRDVYFNEGAYQPDTTVGQHILAHELTHVIQQGEARTKSPGHTIRQTSKPHVQPFFKKLWKGVKKVGKKIGGGIKKAGKWIAGGAKKLWSGAKWLGGKIWSGLKWFGTKLWEKIKGIYHRVKRWITQLPTRLKRLVKHLWKGVKSLKPWSLAWWKKLGKASTWKDFGKWLGEFAIYGLEVLGIGEIYETLMDFIKFNTRPLTASEIATAKTVFGNSIDYSLVRVDQWALLGPSWTGREYVSFHTINAWGPMTNRTLIHELTHVWQYEQQGAMYMPRAIHAQNTPDEYDYGGVPELINRAAKGMAGFNLEQQGEILADYYQILNGLRPHQGRGTAANLPDYEVYVNEVRRS